MSSQSFIRKFQNKEIKVTIVFPETPNEKAEQDFLGYLKNIYLQKLKPEPFQKVNPAPSLLSQTNREGGEPYGTKA